MSAIYPVFLDLAGRDVLVVGAGPVSAEKTRKLLTAGARVRVVSPEVSADFAALELPVARRAFGPDDVTGAWFVLAAAPPEVNRTVHAACEARRVFVLAVDDPKHASAAGGAQIVRGDVTVLVGTSGKAPALAGLLREAFDELLPEDLGALVDVAHALRPRLAALGLSFAERRDAVLAALVDRRARLREASRANANANTNAETAS